MNAEKLLSTVELAFNQKVYSLKFTVKTACLVEKLTGENCLDMSVFKSIGLEKITVLLFAMIKDQDANLTLEKVQELLEFSKISEVSEKVIQAIQAALPRGDTEKNAEKSQPENP